MEQVLKASVSGTFYGEPSASGIRYVIAGSIGMAALNDALQATVSGSLEGAQRLALGCF